MKHLTTIFCLLSCLYASAGHRYVSSSGGNDANTGLDSNHAYKSLAKVNAIFASLAPGDTIYFKRGDVFLGQLLAGGSGVSSHPIVITAYSAGAKPILSGLVTLHNWTNLGSNLWDCQPDSVLKATCNVSTWNGYPREVGRYPNTNSYLLYSSATATTVNTSLTGTPNYTGAEIVMKYVTYVISRKRITAQSGGTLTVTDVQGIDDGKINQNPGSGSNRGYFLQRFQNSLDVNGEWYFNITTNRFRIYSTVNPSTLTIKASFKDTVINCNSRTYITFDNLQIEGGSMYGLQSYNGSNIIVQNCTFLNNTRAIDMFNATHPTIQGNYIRNSFNNAILVNGNSGTPASQVNILNNYVDSSGMLTGMAPFGSDNNMKSIVSRTGPGTVGTYNNIIGNTVKHSGHMGIQFQGSNVLIRRNWIDSVCERLQDGGAIYTFVLNTKVVPAGFYNRIIDSNMVSNAVGTGVWGIGSDQNVDVAGIYMDDQTPNVNINHNTVWNVPGNGVQMNTPTNISVTDNTFYNCLYAFNLNKRVFGTVSGNSASRNIIYQKTTGQYNFYSVNDALSPQTETQWLQGMIVMDSNWVSNLKTNSYRSLTNSGSVGDYNQTVWKGTYLHDAHAVAPPLTVTTSNTQIITNPSDVEITSGFVGFRKTSPKNISSNNYVALPPWTSVVLIDNGTANIPPVSNAGADSTTVLPKDSSTLRGSGTDQDGTISSYLWVKVSGAGGTISTPTAATTKVKSLTAGIYKYSLTVTDNGGSTNTDTVQITVVGNQAPTANAGPDQTLANAASSTAVLGMATDPDGTIVSYNWAVISGPNTPSLATPSLTGTGINGMIPGVYLFKYTVTDNGGLIARDTVIITVQQAVNQLPVADAGANFSITLPPNTSTLYGSATDADGTISTYSWSTLSGPSTVSYGTQNAASSTIGNLVQGVYDFVLTVTDNSGGQDKDTVELLVNAASNMTPLVDAGANQIKVLPVNTATLTGTASDPDGSISTILWTKQSGPTGGTITTAGSLTTGITALQEGVYLYRLTATDNSGASAFKEVQITVNPNPAPVANAGTDIVITAPTNSTTLSGSGTDDVSISSYAWAKVSGTGGSITSPSSASTGLTGLTPGVYQYELTVTDNGGATAKDTVQVTVNLAANQPPVADAGIDRSFDPPRDTITIFGGGADTDGTIVSYAWVKILGPAATINSPTSATTILSGLTSGTYQFELTVTDDRGGIDKDTMTLIVSDQPFNIPPVVTTPHPAIRITLPTDSVTLAGVATDEDGYIKAYEWTGNGGTIVTPNAATTVIKNLAPGTYTFTLTVVDNGNAVASDATTVVVSPAPTKHILLGVKVKN